MTRVAVVHPNTLLGRELRERLAQRTELFGEPRLLSASEDEVGQLAESGGAAAFVARLDDDALEGLDLVFFCGSIELDRPWLDRLPAGAVAIVLSAGATLADGAAGAAALAAAQVAGGRLLVPHPAASGAALLLAHLQPFGVRAAHAVALLPASTRGAEALDQIFAETRALLAFQPPKGGARRQSAFNVVLSAVDADEVARQAIAELGGGFPFSLQLLEAGIFHGVALSLHVELERPADAREIRRALGADPRVEARRKPATVSPVALAGDEHVVIGEVRAGAEPGGFWIWAVYDNLARGGAAAVELAERLLVGASTRPF